ncbi:MAG: hypothetical protein ACE5FI_17575 [Anaerolineales bacterium]
MVKTLAEPLSLPPQSLGAWKVEGVYFSVAEIYTANPDTGVSDLAREFKRSRAMVYRYELRSWKPKRWLSRR